MVPLPEPDPDPDPQPEDISPPPEPEEIPSDEELDAMLGPEEEMEGLESFAPEAEEDISELDEDDLDTLDDPEPIDSVKAENGDDLVDENEVEPDNLPDPDPLPDGFADADDDFDFDYEEEEEGGSGSALKTMAIGLVVIIAIGALVIFPRKMIVDYVPAANDYFYKYVGLAVMTPGEGLTIVPEKPVLETINGEEVVVIRGVISNVVKEPNDVPVIEIIAYDSNDRVVHREILSPTKNRLDIGETIKFTAVIKEKLISTARKVDVTFGKMEIHSPPATKGEATKPAETPAAKK
jgi:hypothetical protein